MVFQRISPVLLLLLSLSILLLSLTACVTGRPALELGVAGQELREVGRAVDISPHSNIVEINLTAAPAPYEFVDGAPTTLWLYNGQLPGPLIEANVGDEIVVHFRNELPEATTIHWHGLRLPQSMDGTHASQDPVPPGGTFEYRFVAPDAGLFWYHPHHNASSQVPLGLYGPLLVRGPDEPQLNRERLLVLSDIELDAAGQVVPPHAIPHTPLTHALGHEGNTLLVNGQIQPRITQRPGSRERWRIVNCAASRYFNLDVPGAQLTLIGTDGGLIDRPVPLDELVIVPGERAEVVVSLPADGTSSRLVNHPFARLFGVDYPQDPTRGLVWIELSGDPVEAPPPIPATLASIPELPAAAAEPHFFLFNARLDPILEEDPLVMPRWPLQLHGGMPGGGAGDESTAEFMINGAVFPDVPRFEARLGEVEEWTVYNHTPMHHPFHMHGFRFQVLSVNNEPLPYSGWRDTIDIPANAAGDVELKLRVMYEGHPGRWVWHCHILHHAETGMMAEFDILP